MILPFSVRDAYERARIRAALLQSVPVLGLLGVCLAVAGVGIGPAVVSAGFIAAFVLARWRGMSWGQGALVGAVAGAFAAAIPVCLLLDGGGCIGPACASACAPICLTAGGLSGAIVGIYARDWRARATAAALAVGAAALGCWPMGVGLVASAAGTLLLGTFGGMAVRSVIRR